MSKKELSFRLLEVNSAARVALAKSYSIERMLDAGKLGSLRILYGLLENLDIDLYLTEKGVDVALLQADIEIQPEVYVPYPDKILVPHSLSVFTISDHLTSSGMRVWNWANAAAQTGKMGEIGVESLFIGVVLANLPETSRLFRKHELTGERLF